MTYEYKGPKNYYVGKRSTIVIVSGYFNPWHDGHSEYCEIARGLGDVLWVIVNNDAQQMIKKHKIIRDEQSRMDEVRKKGYAHEVILSIDTDGGQCKTLEMIIKMNPDNDFIFANGGDRHNEEIPEAKYCREHHIKNIRFVDGCGKKIDSSTRHNIELGLEEPKPK